MFLITVDVKLSDAPFLRVPLKHHVLERDVMDEVTHTLPTPMHGLPVSVFRPSDIRQADRFVE